MHDAQFAYMWNIYSNKDNIVIICEIPIQICTTQTKSYNVAYNLANLRVWYTLYNIQSIILKWFAKSEIIFNSFDF